MTSTERSRKYRARLRNSPNELELYRLRDNERKGFGPKNNLIRKQAKEERKNVLILRGYIVDLIKNHSMLKLLEFRWDVGICPIHGIECIHIQDEDFGFHSKGREVN